MLNTTVFDGGTPPTASNVDSKITEQGMGRLTSFQTGKADHIPKTLKPPKATTASIKSDVL